MVPHGRLLLFWAERTRREASRPAKPASGSDEFHVPGAKAGDLVAAGLERGLRRPAGLVGGAARANVVPTRRYSRCDGLKEETTAEHLVFRWSPAGYALEVRPGDVPPAGMAVHEGEHRYRVAKVASSPLPSDPRACAYLLPVDVSLNGPDDDPYDVLVEPTPVWTEARDDIEVLIHAFPGSSCVVAVDAEGPRLGLTVDSLVSLSLEPPLVGFAVDSDCPMLELLPDAGGCAITILAGGQEWLADHFAEGARPIALWHGLASESGAVGAPLFVGALGWLECSLLESVEIGARTFVVCAVRRVEAGAEAPALVRVRGDYESV